MTIDIKALAKQAGGIDLNSIPSTVFDHVALAEFVRLVRESDRAVLAQALEAIKGPIYGAPVFGKPIQEAITALEGALK